MKSLEKKILEEGTVIGTEIVKIDSFINHQIDVAFLEEIGKEFKRLFADEKVDKVVTVEASGIGIAVITARNFDYVPVVFAKKGLPSTMNEGFYEAECVSFTKGTTSKLRIDKKYLNEGENVLILDDFMATGEAGRALAKICEAAGCHIVGICGVVEKQFQGGSADLRSKGYRVESLAVISKIEDGKLTFVEN